MAKPTTRLASPAEARNAHADLPDGRKGHRHDRYRDHHHQDDHDAAQHLEFSLNPASQQVIGNVYSNAWRERRRRLYEKNREPGGGRNETQPGNVF